MKHADSTHATSTGPVMPKGPKTISPTFPQNTHWQCPKPLLVDDSFGGQILPYVYIYMYTYILMPALLGILTISRKSRSQHLSTSSIKRKNSCMSMVLLPLKSTLLATSPSRSWQVFDTCTNKHGGVATSGIKYITYYIHMYIYICVYMTLQCYRYIYICIYIYNATDIYIYMYIHVNPWNPGKPNNTQGLGRLLTMDCTSSTLVWKPIHFSRSCTFQILQFSWRTDGTSGTESHQTYTLTYYTCIPTIHIYITKKCMSCGKNKTKL